MFPDVRLMVATTFVSVAALMFGFGLFATFRVSHEPLDRAQPVGAPIQLVPDNSPKPVAAMMPEEPFERRFLIAFAPSVPETPRAPAPGPDLQDDIETFSSARPTTLPEGTAAVEEPNDRPVLPAAEPADASVAATAPASEQPASAPPQETPAVAATEPQDSAPVPASGTAALEQQSKSDADPAANTEPAAAPGVTALNPGKDWRADWTPAQPTAQRPNAVAPKASVPRRVARVVRPTIVRPIIGKNAWPTRVAVRPRPARRMAAAVPVRTFSQNNGFEQSNYQTQLQAQAQFTPRRVVRVRHAYVAPDRPAEQTSAVGGPYVSP
jgi:hypothetical protein